MFLIDRFIELVYDALFVSFANVIKNMSDHTYYHFMKLKDLINAKLNYMGTSNPNEPLYEIDDVETFNNQLVDSKNNNELGSSVHAEVIRL